MCLKIIFQEGELIQKLFTQHYKESYPIDISSLVHFSEKDNLQEIIDLAQKIEKKNFTFVNFDENIYGKVIKVSFLDKIRDEKKFESLTQLKEQITKDIECLKL